MKKVFFIAACITSLSAEAQVAFGPEAGFNINTINTSGTNGFTSKSGGRFGAIVDFPVAQNLYIQPGLFYITKGGNLETTSTQDLSQLASLGGLGDLGTLLGGLGGLSTVTTTTNKTYAIHYVQLPINLLYKFNSKNNNHFFAGLSVYAAYAADGKYSASTATTIAGLNINSNENRAISDDDMSPFDAGAGINLGYEHNSGFFVRGFYEMGFIDNDLGTNRSFGLSIGFLIRDKAAN